MEISGLENALRVGWDTKSTLNHVQYLLNSFYIMNNLNGVCITCFGTWF